MKGIFIKIILTIVFLIVVFASITMIYPLKGEAIGTVEDLNGNVVSAFYNDYNFIWQGGVFWKYTVRVNPQDGNDSFILEKKIPSLQGIRLRDYLILIPLHFSYKIELENFKDFTLLGSGRKKLTDLIKKYLEGSISREINDYLEPAYRRNQILMNSDRILGEAIRKAGERLKSHGIILSGCELTGDISCPDMNTYRRGLVYAEEIRKLFIQNEKQLAQMKSNLEQDKIKNQAYYKKLSEISGLIRSNPEMLKYLYIEKMSDNVKVIISSDKTGVPFLIDGSKKDDNLLPSTKREIDNLR